MENKRNPDIKKIIIRLAVAAVFIVVACVSAFFLYTLVLRTDYKDTALEINKYAAQYKENTVISRGDVSGYATSDIVDFYDKFLLDTGTQVYSRESAPVTDETICLRFGDHTLSLTGLEDGSAIQILWTGDKGEKSFRVRSITSFMQLSAYFSNHEEWFSEHPY